MNKFYKVSEFAELLGVSIKTLQRWDNIGVLKARRTPTNRRCYTHDDYEEYIANGITERNNNVKAR